MKTSTLPGRHLAIALVLLVSLTAAAPGVWGQYSANPLDPIYHWLDLWEGRGYLQNMPVFRPYPENVLVPALERVQRTGDPESRARATEFLQQLDDTVDMEWSVIQETRVQNDLLHLKGGVGLTVHGRISDTVTAAASITGVLLDVEEGELLPAGRRTDWDILDDWSTIPVAGRDLAALTQMNTSFAWGGESLYLHAGIMRRSFGPLHDDGIVLSPYARQAPGVVTSWRPGRFQYSFGLFSMTATQLYDPVTPFNDPNTDVVAPAGTDDLFRDPDEFPGKWVFIHDFRWNALPWLTVAFFESVTWGPRFELAYLMPVKWGFHAQGAVSYADSSKMGFSVEARPRADLRVPFMVYVDDASFNDLVRFNFNTKLKMGLHTAVIWTPLQPFLRRVSLDYLALLPYMYTHDGEGGHFDTEPNYTNYLHRGVSLGPGLDPNSDRLTLAATVQPLPRLNATVTGRLIRHGNASEGVEGLGLISHDGSILDDGRYYYFRREEVGEGDPPGPLVVESGRLSFQDELRFLNQRHIEHTWQAGIDLAYRIPVDPRRRIGISVEAGYQFEYIRGPLGAPQPTGETAVLRDPSREADPRDLEAVIYKTVPGPDEVNHYVNLVFRVLY